MKDGLTKTKHNNKRNIVVDCIPQMKHCGRPYTRKETLP